MIQATYFWKFKCDICGKIELGPYDDFLNFQNNLEKNEGWNLGSNQGKIDKCKDCINMNK